MTPSGRWWSRQGHPTTGRRRRSRTGAVLVIATMIAGVLGGATVGVGPAGADGSPQFTSAPSATLVENAAGSFTVSVTGDGPLTLAESGTLPSNVAFADQASPTNVDTATLAGTPIFGTAGVYSIDITATDANANTATQTFTLTVAPGNPMITSAGATTFTENAPGTFTVTADGDSPITDAETGALPAGVTLSPDGTLSGTPAFGTAGTYPIDVTATDANANTATQTFTLTVAPGNPVITSAAATTFTENAQGTFTVTADGDGPFTYAETGALPAGVTLSPDGTLSGTPAFGTAGTDTIDVTATDANANTATQTFTLTVAPGSPVITSAAATTFTENAQGTFTVTADGDGPFTFTVAFGSLPSGVSLTPGGLMAGTPAFGTNGDYPMLLEVTDTNGNIGFRIFNLVVEPGPPVFTSGAAAAFDDYEPGTFALSADGDGPFTYTEVGRLPSGVSLSAAGVLTGTPTVSPGTYTVGITVTGQFGLKTTEQFTLTIVSDFQVTTTALPDATVGQLYRGPLSAAHGLGPYLWKRGTQLPRGLKVDKTGSVSGVPLKVGSFHFAVQVSDATRPHHLVAVGTVTIVVQ